MKVSLGFERQKLNPTKDKKTYIKEDITQFYRRQLHTICMGDIDMPTKLLEEDQEYIISETQIMNLSLKVANVHLNSQKNQQWKTLQQLIDLDPDIIIGDFNIPNLLSEQRIISRKLTITKLLGNYKNIIAAPTKGDSQIDYIFIKRSLFEDKILTISDRSTVAINSDHVGLLLTLKLKDKIKEEPLLQETKKKQKTQAELTKIVNLSYHSKEELVLDQLSKTQQLLQFFKSNSVSSLPYANPVGIQVWKKKIALLLWDTQLHHQIDAKQFIIDSSKDFGYNVSKETKQSSKLYQELTNHNAEELGRETQRISNQEQELPKFQQQIYSQFNTEYNKLQTYKRLIISEEAPLEERRVQTENVELQDNRLGFTYPKFIELPTAGINTSSICTIDRLNYVNPTKATGRNQIPCALFSILSKNIEMRQVMQQRIFNYYNNLLFSRNSENKIRATQYLIKKPQGNFFKLRGLEIPNIEQKVFGNCQTKLQKFTRQPYERYQFAYEQDTGTTKAAQNFINFILEEKQLSRDILILVLDAEGGFNRSDKIHSIQSMNKILKHNGYNLNIRETINAAQIEEMSHPIGISRTKPNQNRIYQLHGVPQGSATSPETYCISLDEGIQNFHKRMKEQNQRYLLNAYMDDLILIFSSEQRLTNDDILKKFAGEVIDDLQKEIKRYNPSYQISIEKTEIIKLVKQESGEYQQSIIQRDVKNFSPLYDHPFKYLGIHYNFGRKNIIEQDLAMTLQKLDNYQSRNVSNMKFISQNSRKRLRNLIFSQYFMGNINYRANMIDFASEQMINLMEGRAIMYQLGQHKSYINDQLQFYTLYQSPLAKSLILKKNFQLLNQNNFCQQKFLGQRKEQINGPNINLIQNIAFGHEHRFRRIKDKKVNTTQPIQRTMDETTTLSIPSNQEFHGNEVNREEEEIDNIFLDIENTKKFTKQIKLFQQQFMLSL